MPINDQRTRGLSPGEVFINSGGEQFFLYTKADSPATVGIAFAQLPDGSQFAGDPLFAGTAPGFINSATNYIWFRLSIAALESNATGFPEDGDIIPLWSIDIDGAGAVSNILDKRPWFGGSGSGGANSVEERLKEELEDSVMEFARIDPLFDEDDIDVISTGTFLAQNEYELSPTDFLQSAFASAPLLAPTTIDQVTVVVLADQIFNPTDLQIEVSRVTPPLTYPADFETVAANLTNHVFTGGGTNVLNIRITNIGAADITIAGYGLYYNNIGGPTGQLGDKSGVVLDVSGLNIYNTNPAAYRVSAANFGFTWTVTGGPSPGTGVGNLAWAPASGAAPGSGLDIEITDPLTGTFIQTLVASGDTATTFSIPDVGPGGYLYFDVDRVASSVTLQYSVGAPVMIKDRFILGKRTLGVTGVNDTFTLFNNHTLPDSNTIPQSSLLQVPPSLLTNNQLNAIKASNAPTGLNPIATMLDVAGAVPSITATQVATTTAIGLGTASLGSIVSTLPALSAGTYLVSFSGYANFVGIGTVSFALFGSTVGQILHSARAAYLDNASFPGDWEVLSTQALVTVPANEVITARANGSVGLMNIDNRSLIALKVG